MVIESPFKAIQGRQGISPAKPALCGSGAGPSRRCRTGRGASRTREAKNVSCIFMKNLAALGQQREHPVGFPVAVEDQREVRAAHRLKELGGRQRRAVRCHPAIHAVQHRACRFGGRSPHPALRRGASAW